MFVCIYIYELSFKSKRSQISIKTQYYFNKNIKNEIKNLVKNLNYERLTFHIPYTKTSKS